MATQKIYFFTGKGGVGKSTIAAAYALSHVSSLDLKNKTLNKKNLLVETSNTPLLPQFISPKKDQLDIAHWTTELCLEEYATNLIKSARLVKLFLNNTVSKSLINIAPGLQELALLGKATSSPRNHGPVLNYDEIFIDSFSTGHFVQMMTTPQSFTEIFTKGPMATQSQSINQWIKDPDFATIFIVTTSDELSITEGLECFEQLKKSGFKPRFILNKMIHSENIKVLNYGTQTQNFFNSMISQQLEAENKIQKKDKSYLKTYFSFQTETQEIVNDIAGFINI